MERSPQRPGGRRIGKTAAMHPGLQLIGEIERYVRARAEQFQEYDRRFNENFRVIMLAAKLRWRDGMTYQQIVDALRDEGHVRSLDQVKNFFRGI